MGEWIKGVGGNITITNEPHSNANLNIYESMFLGGWNLYRSLLPGTHVDVDGAGGEVKFEVPNRRFLSASDVPGGFDACFEGVWFKLRVR